MREQWKAGQCVRVGGRCRVNHYAPGGTGVVLSGPHRTLGRELGYLVQMGEGNPKQIVLLFDDEVQADVGPQDS